MNTRLLLVRHGRTAYNAEIRFMGQLDIPMDAVGLRQVQALARRLSAEQPSVIYCSDLDRARATALEIKSAISAWPPVKEDVRLREMDFGSWQGMTYAEINQQDPDSLARWREDRLRAPPGGETLAAFAARVQAACDEICDSHPDQTVVIAGHGGPLQVIIAHALGLPLDAYWKVDVSNASLSELRLHPAGAVLHLLNDTSHWAGTI
jgi:alpha-ribazole phosphatase